MVLPGSHRILRGEQMSLLWPINVDGKATVDLFKKKIQSRKLVKILQLVSKSTCRWGPERTSDMLPGCRLDAPAVRQPDES